MDVAEQEAASAAEAHHAVVEVPQEEVPLVAEELQEAASEHTELENLY